MGWARRWCSWPRPALFSWLQQDGGIPEDDLLRTFNCGIGMTVVVAHHEADQVQQILERSGETVYRIGEITPGTGRVDIRP